MCAAAVLYFFIWFPEWLTKGDGLRPYYYDITFYITSIITEQYILYMPLIIYRGWFVYTVITIPIRATAAFVKQLIFQGLL